MRISIIALAFTMLFAASAASAALPVGAAAPDFALRGALAGKPLTFSLHQALRKGPVVLYFFPAAFTSGCTVEAHLFAEATDTFRKLGATVIGVTAGNVERVAEFSREACRDKFAVAADPGATVAARFQATNGRADRPLSDRTSFVIAPGGKILLSYTDPNPQQHVQRSLAAVKSWRANRR